MAEPNLFVGVLLSPDKTRRRVSEPWTAFVSGEAAIAFPIQECNRGVTVKVHDVLRAAATAAKAQGVTCESVHAKDQYPAEGIMAAATKYGCDLIVMASHGHRGLTRLFLGSQTNNVVTQSTIPVLISRCKRRPISWK